MIKKENPWENNRHNGLPSPTEQKRRYLDMMVLDVPDFPKKGIVFKDISYILSDWRALHIIEDLISSDYLSYKPDYVACIEARGFLLGSFIARGLGAGIIPIRKVGKLPRDTYKESYPLEYGTDTLEIHKDCIEPNSKVLLIDDVLATGGTAKAATQLIEKCKGIIIGTAFLIELKALKGRDKLDGIKVTSILEY